MFHFTPSSQGLYAQQPSYGQPLYPTFQQPSSNLRDNYLSAIANAKAAEAQYLAAEAVQREEDALRRRLQEIEYTKRVQSLPAISPYPPVPSYSPTTTLPNLLPSYPQDQLALLRKQIAQEEEEASMLAARIQLERVTIAKQRQEDERKALELKQAEQARQVAQLKKEYESLQRVRLQPKSVQKCTCHQTQRKSSGSSKELTIHDIIQVLSGQVPAPQAQAKPRVHVCAPVQRAAPVAYVSAKPRVTAPTVNVRPTTQAVPSPSHVQKAAFIGELLNSYVPSSVPAPSSGTSTESTESAPSSKKAGVAQDVVTREFISQLFGVPLSSVRSVDKADPPAKPAHSETAPAPVKPVATSTAPSSSNTVQAQDVETPSINGAVGSLRAELEKRLNNDESVEIHDTIQAILASLADDTASSSSSPPPAQDKGKGKAVDSEPTSKDIASAVETVRNIDATFTALQSEFTFPQFLEFTTPTSSPALSDSESFTNRLTFSAQNQPVRYYEQSLTGFIAQLDEIDSFGDEELRKRRKEVVSRVEQALNDLEGEIEGRWRSRQNKEKRASQIPEVSHEAPIATAVSETLPASNESPVAAVVVAEDITPTASVAEAENIDAVVEASSVTSEVASDVGNEDTTVQLVEEEPTALEVVQNEYTVSASNESLSTSSLVEDRVEGESDTGSSTVQENSASYPPRTYVSESTATVQPYDVDVPSLSYPPHLSASVATIRPSHIDTKTSEASDSETEGDEEQVLTSMKEEADSDWSEVEA